MVGKIDVGEVANEGYLKSSLPWAVLDDAFTKNLIENTKKRLGINNYRISIHYTDDTFESRDYFRKNQMEFEGCAKDGEFHIEGSAIKGYVIKVLFDKNHNVSELRKTIEKAISCIPLLYE